MELCYKFLKNVKKIVLLLNFVHDSVLIIFLSQKHQEISELMESTKNK